MRYIAVLITVMMVIVNKAGRSLAFFFVGGGCTGNRLARLPIAAWAAAYRDGELSTIRGCASQCSSLVAGGCCCCYYFAYFIPCLFFFFALLCFALLCFAFPSVDRQLRSLEWRTPPKCSQPSHTFSSSERRTPHESYLSLSHNNLGVHLHRRAWALAKFTCIP